MACLADLAEELNNLLPTCPSGQVCEEYHTITPSSPCFTLKHLPTGSVTLYSNCLETIDTSNYVVDYTTGTVLAPCANGATHFIVSYTFNLAETYIRQAVADLGFELPQRNIMQVPLFADCGKAPLPCNLKRIFYINEIPCPEPEKNCSSPCTQVTRCGCSKPGVYGCTACDIFVQNDILYVRPPVCEDRWLQICYEGGYPLDENGCYPGLSDDLAQLVLLRAQALAYRNPKLLLDLAGVSTTTKSSNNNNSSTFNEVTTVVKTYGTCGKDETTTTTKTGNSSSGNEASINSLFGSNSWSSLATQFQADYEAAIRKRTGLATIHARRNGYRARLVASAC